MPIISNKSEIDVKVLGRHRVSADKLELISMLTDMIIDGLAVGTVLLTLLSIIKLFRWWREGRGLEQACLASPGAEQYCSTLNSDCDSRNARGKAAGQVRADQGRHELPTALPYIAP